MPVDSSAKITRRGFGRLAVAAPIAATAAAATPGQERRAEVPVAPAQPAAQDPIAAFDVPMATEPGFVYRP